VGSSAAGGPIPVLNNAGYAEFYRDLTQYGIDVLNVWPASVKTGEIRYLVQDTHWTPEYMESVAEIVAAHVRQFGGQESASLPAPFRVIEQRVSRVGDLVDMLKLTSTQKLYTPQTVTTRRIIDERTGKDVEADSNSDILLIGDSFTNVYSQAELGWGEGAGFAEQLAYRLGRRVDLISLNGGGAWRARSELARTENAQRLGRKKVIVYQFAIRNLAGENWKVVPMVTPIPPPAELRSVVARNALPTADSQPQRPPGGTSGNVATGETDKSTSGTQAAGASTPLTIIGTIVKASKVPAPGSAPYKDCLTFVKVQVEKVVSGKYGDSELIAAFWAMKDNEWLPPASYAVGERLTLTLTPLNKAEAQIRSMQRADDLDDYTHQPMYVLEEKHSPR
jgi:alginate O-acetyltransferase complex protein AlgJ